MDYTDLDLIKAFLSDPNYAKEDIIKRLEQDYPQKRYNHAFSIAFRLESDNEGDKVTNKELLKGLMRRIYMILNEEEGDFIECCGLPFDTYENY